jgi:hypothetical protein
VGTKVIFYGFKINPKTYIRMLLAEKNGETKCSKNVASAM